jgi:7-cyano-7-deazaguanine reductase
MNDALERKYQTHAVNSELGQTSNYDDHYNPDRLFAIPRAVKRQELGIIANQLPFHGFDCWNHYEVSWLNEKGVPQVAVAEIVYDCATPYLIESKSLKLYFNSLNNTQFKDSEAVRKVVEQDLGRRLEGDVSVRILPLLVPELSIIHPSFSGICLDSLDVTCSVYLVEPDYLNVGDHTVEEVVYSDLLKSNCLVTNQPDWGSVQIAYKGKQINHEGLLKYIVSFRNHNEFHEQCIERIFIDILNRCNPEQLTVYGRYTRRGGLDINPYRSTSNVRPADFNRRLIRQ